MSKLQSKRRLRTVNIKLLNKLIEKSSEILSKNNDEDQYQILIDIRELLMRNSLRLFNWMKKSHCLLKRMINYSRSQNHPQNLHFYVRTSFQLLTGI